MILRRDGWRPPDRKGAELALDLPLNSFQSAVAERIEYTEGHGKHHARCAIFHLGRAWAIREVDPEMAAFRVLCAGEEAASAVFRALQRREYDGADRLLPKDHRHKAALAVLLRAVETHLATAGFSQLTRSDIVVNTRDPSESLGLRVRLQLTPGSWTPWLSSTPPLEMELQANGVAHDFEQDIRAVTHRATLNAVRRFVGKLSNQRNLLLYASPNGVAFVDPANTENVIRENQRRVFGTLVVFEMIDSHVEHQRLVKQGLSALLELIPPSKPKPRVRVDED